MEILNENGLDKIYVCMTVVILDNHVHPKDTASTGSCMVFVWAMTSQTSGVPLVSKYWINPVSLMVYCWKV